MFDEVNRHRSEVREWLRRGSDKPADWVKKLLTDIAKRRGMEAAERLRKDIVAQWKAGNRGAFGDWRE